MWRHSYCVSACIATLRYTILPYHVLPCEIVLRVPIQITVHVLAAGCQLSYRKFYGFFKSGFLLYEQKKLENRGKDI